MSKLFFLISIIIIEIIFVQMSFNVSGLFALFFTNLLILSTSEDYKIINYSWFIFLFYWYVFYRMDILILLIPITGLFLKKYISRYLTITKRSYFISFTICYSLFVAYSLYEMPDYSYMSLLNFDIMIVFTLTLVLDAFLQKSLLNEKIQNKKFW